MTDPAEEAPGRAVSPARSVAFDLLRAVLAKRRPLDEALDAHGGLALLSARDRAFARLLAATVLRRLGQLDALIDHCLAKPLPPKAGVVRDVLRLGTAQLVFLGTPPHAAVDSAVTLAVSRGFAPFKGVVNAVLRRLAREHSTLVAGQDAVALDIPAWMLEGWSAAYGAATARAIGAVILGEPPLDISVKGDPEGWAARLEARLLPTGTLRRTAGGAVAELPGYGEGAWWVQDAAAALPARLLGPLAGRRVVDLCAAPGGKTAQLAAGGAEVIAVDRSAPRLATLARNLGRLGLAAATVAADAVSWRPPRPPEAVLLDAPCSATGTIRRHPDILRLKQPRDVERLADLQRRLLEAAAAMLAPGGTLVYCVCSLEPAEGPAQVARLLDSGAPLERRPIAAAEVGGLGELLTQDGDLRTLPCHLAEIGGLDGFYAARLVRRA